VRSLRHFIDLSLGFWICYSGRRRNLKCRIATTTTKDESVAVGDEERHSLHLLVTEGLAFFENGEIAKVKAHVLNDRISEKRRSVHRVCHFTFEDGSTIVQRFQTIIVSGGVPAKVISELIKGTGRFNGIKGTASGASKTFPASKGELARNTSDLTFNFTLSPK